jgi:hypothetical protein
MRLQPRFTTLKRTRLKPRVPFPGASYFRGTAPGTLIRASYRLSAAGAQLDCLDGGYLAAFDLETQKRPDLMPAMVAASAGIHVNEAERLVAHDFQDVGVTADEQSRPQPMEFLPCPAVVIAGVPSDVGHVNRDALAIPNEILGNFKTEFRTVNIPVNAPEWFEGLEPGENVGCPEVARVPDLVAFGEIAEDSVVQKSMCVGEQPDSHSSAYAPPGDHRMRRCHDHDL